MSNSISDAIYEYNKAVEARFESIESLVGQALAWNPILQFVIHALTDSQKQELASHVENLDKSIYPEITRQWLGDICSIVLRQTGSAPMPGDSSQ